MNQTQVHKTFTFNAKIDEDWLYGMYEADYPYIMEIFSNSLDSLKEELPVLTAAFDQNDVAALKKAIHKLKPVLGFVGLLDHQEIAARFENSCASARTAVDLTLQYIETLDAIKDARSVLQDECKRLNDFIS
jgi:HPt (histidine-containing phosphotransfer) domain-containing protein